MRKVLFPMLALILMFGLALPMATPAMANGVEPPPGTECVTLWAGQDIDAGCVYVWNDADYLYVRYETSGEWVMTETHLHVAMSLEAIPQTQPNKKGNGGGNPIPGQFDYSDPHGLVTEYTYEIDRDELALGTLYIAAHAVVQTTDTTSECLVSGAGSDDVLYLAEDPLKPGYPDGYTGPYQSYPGTLIPSVLAWTHSAWAPYGVAGAEWISSSYYTENTDNNTWRLFTRNFPLPTDATNISGTLTMNCDNAEDVYLNGTWVGDGSPAIVYGVPCPPNTGGQHGWNSVESWDVSSGLIAGDNELWTMTRNYAWGGGPTGNPTGLIYKLCYSYDVVTTETAWAGTRVGELAFPGKNWATYFTYELERVLVDTVTVPAAGTVVYSNITLDDGVEYLLEASGTAFAGDTIDFDAKYSITNRIPGDTWTDTVSGYEGYGTGLLDLKVNGAFVGWGVFNPAHVYSLTMTGTGATVELQIYDIYYPNNTGELTVEIYK